MEAVLAKNSKLERANDELRDQLLETPSKNRKYVFMHACTRA